MSDIRALETEMNHLFDQIEDDPSERKNAIIKLRNIRQEVEKRISDNKMNLAVAQEYICEKEKLIKNNRVADKEKRDAHLLIVEQQDKILILEKEIASLCNISNILDEYITGKKFFDKYKCFQNIRKLMREKNVKLGQIESEAGVRTGYMSRLEKSDNDSEPGILFLVAAADLLGVTMDELIFSDPNELTEDERYVNEFLHDLIRDTDSHDLRWVKENEKILNNVYFLPNRNIPEHPLLSEDDNQIDDDGMPMLVHYISPFYRESNIRVKSCYSTSLPDTESEVFLVWCGVAEDDKEIPESEFYEVYVTDEEDIANPICNTLKSASTISATMNSLFKLASSDAANVHINKNARSVIDAYRRRHQPLPF